jgi:hypothetical protein
MKIANTLIEPNADFVLFLREEVRKSRQYLISNKVIYTLNPSDFGSIRWPWHIEDYCNRRVWIEFWFGRLGVPSEIYVAIIEKARLHAKIDCSISIPSSNLYNSSRDNLMLIGNIQGMQHPEDMLFCAIPSVIRLKRFDDVLRSWRKRLNLFTEFPVVTSAKNGKPNLLVGEFRCEKSQLPCESIKGRPQVVNSIANQESEARRRSSNSFQPKMIPSLLQTFLLFDGIGCRFHEDTQLGIQRFEVFLRPFQLQTAIFQRGHIDFSERPSFNIPQLHLYATEPPSMFWIRAQ